MHNEYVGKQDYLVQRKLFIIICWKARIPGAEAAMQNEYAGKQEYLLQRELYIMNMMESKNTWCRGNFAK
jgi:hypothetical protein